MSGPVAADAVVLLEAGLAADQAERERRRAKWERRLAIAHRWKSWYTSEPLGCMMLVAVPVGMFYLWAAIRGKASMVYWMPLFFLLRALVCWTLRGVERLIYHLARREGIDLAPHAEDGPG